MKKVLQKKQFARKLIDHAPALRKRETTIMAADLRKTFGIPFSVRREAYRTIVSWKLGPRRITVWRHLMFHFPQYAGEELIFSSRELNYRFDEEGLICIRLPSSLRRLDLFSAPISMIPELVADGANPEEMEDTETFTPLSAAVWNEDDERALALARAGVDLIDCSPMGFTQPDPVSMPAFAAFVQAHFHIAPATANAQKSGGRSCRI